MLAEPKDQQKLLGLAELDTQILQVLHKRSNLPEHAEIVALAEVRKKTNAALIAANTAVVDAQYALEKVAHDIAPIKERISRDKKRLDDGSVSDAKVVSGLIGEIENLEKRLVVLEDVELEAMQALEDAQEEQQRIDKLRAEGEEEIRRLIKKRDKKLTELDHQSAELHHERQKISSELPGELVAIYDKIRDRTGLGAAKIERGHCTGCGLEINSAELRRIATAIKCELVRCEQCGRILVAVNIS